MRITGDNSQRGIHTKHDTSHSSQSNFSKDLWGQPWLQLVSVPQHAYYRFTRCALSTSKTIGKSPKLYHRDDALHCAKA